MEAWQYNKEKAIGHALKIKIENDRCIAGAACWVHVLNVTGHTGAVLSKLTSLAVLL